MPTIIRKRGWSARITYTYPPNAGQTFVAYGDGDTGHAFFRTRREARTWAADPEWGHTKLRVVRATLTLRVEDR